MKRVFMTVALFALAVVGCEPAQAPKPNAATPVSLRVIPKPADGSRSVLDIQTADKPLNAGGDPKVVLDCAKCNNPLSSGSGIAMFEGTGGPVVLHCNKCDAYNELVK